MLRSESTPPSPSLNPSALCAPSVSAWAPLQLHRHPERGNRRFRLCRKGSAFLSALATPRSPLATKFLGMIFFACLHQLTPTESYSCRKQGGRGSKPQPIHFHSFPHRVNIRRTATPATPISSIAYLTVLCIPGGGGHTLPSKRSRPSAKPRHRASSLYFPISSSDPHGTKLPPARLHRCGGDVHA